MNFKKTVIYIILCLFLIINSVSKANEPLKIKFAIIDNLLNIQTQFVSDEYTQSYVGGIKLAILDARKENIDLTYDPLFYVYTPLNIYNVIPKAKQKDNDFIIGPRWSDQFLLLKNEFKNLLVLSPFATANEVYKMPNNFYTLGTPNDTFLNVVKAFLEAKFPGKAPFLLVQADCKNCMSLSNSFEKLYHNSPSHYYLESSVENLNISNLLNHYHKGSPIFLLSTGYSAGILMARISDYLRDNNIVFVGGDGWGSYKAWDIGKVQSTYSYIAYHITPWSLDVNSPVIDSFNRNYLKRFHTPPDNIAYVAYQTVMSVVEALNKYPNNEINIKNRILKSYLTAIARNKNWFRPSTFYIYLVNKKGERLVQSIDMNNGKIKYEKF